MREARIILPSSADGHKWLRDELVFHFGGYTRYVGSGNCKGELEEIAIYDVAFDIGKTLEDILFAIAQNLLRLTDEESIYLRYPSGYVVFVNQTD